MIRAIPETPESLATATQDAEAKRALEAVGVSFDYGTNLQALCSVSVDVIPGSFLAILGTNGSGKSTLLSCLDGILSPTAGHVLLNGTPLTKVPRTARAQQIAFVAQHSHANSATVYDALLLGRKPYLQGAPTEEDYGIVDAVIGRFGLERFALRGVDELSGGEYQKMVIARAFVQQPDFLLLDEPANNLDIANQQEVFGLVRSAVDETGLAAVAVLHDLNQALAHCDRFLFMKDGRMVAHGGREIVTEDIIYSVYGVRARLLDVDGRLFVLL